VSEEIVLRTQTSAHQNELLSKGVLDFCVLGDVFRKDEIDATHYPVFHQMETMKLFKVTDLQKVLVEMARKNKNDFLQFSLTDLPMKERYRYFDQEVENGNLVLKLVAQDLKETHENLMKHLFKNAKLEFRWSPDSFPFTEPSFELEVLLKEKWLEVLGSGTIG
jgi:phenylalanyl-tRNA synthetase alpha chain